MKKLIFLEGLPNVGKTYILNEIRKKQFNNMFFVDELINPDINNPFTDSEDLFLKNDEMKVAKYNDGTIIIDRGPISTLVYNQVLHLIDTDYETKYVEDWFKQFIDIYQDNNTFNYYLYNVDKYIPSLDDDYNPFGSINNLKLTLELTLYNLNKYAKNFKIIEYREDNVEDIINEIIS